MNIIGRAEAAVSNTLNRARRRSHVVDHVWLAFDRYYEVFAPRLAAAIAYYGFFAALALALLAYSILGYVLAGDQAAVRVATRYLATNMPFLKTSDIQNARQTVAIISTVGLVFAGVGWVDGMRSAQRAVWDLDQQPGNPIIRWLVDLAMLVGLGLLLGLSLWVTDGIQLLAREVVSWVSPSLAGGVPRHTAKTLLSILGQGLALTVDLLMAAALLVAVPRLKMTVRRLLPSVLLVGIGFTLLSTAGRILIRHTEHNPAYQVAGWEVGLLLYFYIFSQLLLFGAALAATSRRGRVRDLAAGPPPPPLRPVMSVSAPPAPARKIDPKVPPSADGRGFPANR